MAMIAARCPQYEVTVVDIDADRIRAWQTDNLPIYEPGLLELLRSARGRNLFFSTDIEEAIDDAEIIFVSVNTPTKTFGEGAGKAADLQYWEKTARTILDASRANKIFDSMEKPAFVFDGRNLLDHEALYRIGFSVFPIGKPPLKQF